MYISDTYADLYKVYIEWKEYYFNFFPFFSNPHLLVLFPQINNFPQVYSFLFENINININACSIASEFPVLF